MPPRKPISLKIDASGVRGIVGDSLTPQLVTSFSAAFGTYCGTGPILIGTDTRPSREMVTQAAIAGLLSVGCTPVSLGIVPAPALQNSIRETGAIGGICITASHNPMEWNALKFFGKGGIVLRANQFDELTDLYHQGIYPRVNSRQIADARTDSSAVRRHREAVLRSVNVELIRTRKFKVAVDCCNGAASRATPEFLEALGCQVVEIYTDLTEPFPRNPEPLSEHLGDLCRLVRESGADLGFAQDADADRLAVVNERGEPLGEDCTVALAVRHVLMRRPGSVVVSLSTSQMVGDIVKQYGGTLHETRVGEINLVEKMLQCGARIGGEGNGGVIAPEVNPCRDSFVGMAYLLEALAEEGGSIGEMRNRIPVYAMVKDKMECRARDVAPALRLLRQLYRGEKMVLTDGVKILWPGRWLHVRGSNTEPVIRVLAEAATADEARSMVLGVMEYLRPSGG